MRCQNCARHVEDHETMVKRTVMPNLFQRQDKLVCLNCVDSFDKEYAEVIRIRRFFVFGLIVLQIIGSIIAFILIHPW